MTLGAVGQRAERQSEAGAVGASSVGEDSWAEEFKDADLGQANWTGFMRRGFTQPQLASVVRATLRSGSIGWPEHLQIDM